MWALPFRRIMIDGEAVAHRLRACQTSTRSLAMMGMQARACMPRFVLARNSGRAPALKNRAAADAQKAFEARTMPPVLRFSDHPAGVDGEVILLDGALQDRLEEADGPLQVGAAPVVAEGQGAGA